MKNFIIPSIIAQNQKEFDERIAKTDSKIYQLDFMDGKFVKNKSLLFDFKIRKMAKYEAHLMLSEPTKWIEKYAKKVDTVIFHIESVKNPFKIIESIKNKGKKVGIALSPKTPVKEILSLLNSIDMVLVMTVHPGKYGSEFIQETLSKIAQLKEINPNLRVEVDGGINPETISQASEAGANSFVVGSFLQNSENPKKAINQLRRRLK